MDIREQPPLCARDLYLKRGGRQVLRGVSADFKRGEVTALVGPSGAGKTSLLRCLNRLEEPESGSVLLDGTDIRTLVPTKLRAKVGMIFQTPVIFEGGVRANLTYGLEGTSEDSLVRALQASALAESFLERESPALSVGQAQRVCIARALVRDPEVLLMDEPTSALDRDAAAKIERLVVSLAREQDLAVVLVTHNLEQAERVADRAVLLVAGLVEAEGPPEELAGSWPEEDPA